jgi:hypothetical protein
MLGPTSDLPELVLATSNDTSPKIPSVAEFPVFQTFEVEKGGRSPINRSGIWFRSTSLFFFTSRDREVQVNQLLEPPFQFCFLNALHSTDIILPISLRTSQGEKFIRKWPIYTFGLEAWPIRSRH